MRLTATRIRALKPTGKRFEVSDEGCTGLYLRVGQSGAKTFVYKYRQDGRLQRLSLGRYPDLSLYDARAKASDLTRRRRLGENICRKSREEATISYLAELYIPHLQRRGKKTWAEDQRIFNTDFLPKFGGKKAASIRRRELIEMLNEIAENRGAGCMANRTLSCIRSFFRWAACEDLIDADPTAGIRKRFSECPRERSLSESEIQRFWTGLVNSPLSSEMQIALKLILLTGKRTTEIVHAQWSEIDNEWWNTPSRKSKTGVMSRTPILPLTAGLIEQLREYSGHSDWLFPSPSMQAPLRIDSVCKAVARLRETVEIPHWTARDLRRTTATHLGRLGVADHVIGKILNHSDGRVTAIYNRHSYDFEKREALRRWDTEVAKIVADDGCDGIDQLGKITSLQHQETLPRNLCEQL